MEVVHQEEAMGSNEYNLHVVKGKRTKRQRPLSPLTVAMTTSSSSGGGGGGGGGGGRDDFNFSSPTTSVEFSGSSEEEEDMANCLILLAQGGHGRDGSSKQIEESGATERLSSRRFGEIAITTTSKGGSYVYECKTCNRCFPSFQALGGHRASHKRPNKQAMVEDKMKASSSAILMVEEEISQFINDQNSSPSLTLQMGNSTTLYSTTSNKSRVHECSICGSEFSSGQALGGHMRRHRTSSTTTTVIPATTTATTTSMSSEFSHQEIITKKPKNVLSLDLNLPAPEEDHRESKFLFSSKQQPLVFSASALVDCHY
ncbi:zinc finger protein [Macleaya cordata]|uniref:Zinc finger protein n=1 Tax=Macleaya cordata TaxID=56857 RepID=A0A200R9U1_MACCD|nr:zinc finger protein [Macleaya cordata]